LSKGYTEIPSPGIEPGTSVSGAVGRNHVPRLKVGTHWGHVSYIYPRTAQAAGSRSTSTIGELVGPSPPRSTTYGCVHYRAHHGDLTTVLLRGSDVVLEESQCPALHYSKSTEPLLPYIKVSPISTGLGKFDRIHLDISRKYRKSTEKVHQPLPGRPSNGRTRSGQRSFNGAIRRRPKAELYFWSLLSKGYTEMPPPGIEPAPPCPEPYAITKYRAEMSIPIGDISHIYTPVLPEQWAPAVHPLLAR
jgi:hypothetical protein